MAKMLVIYYSQSGNTKKMAEAVAEGIKQQAVEADLKEVKAVKPEELLEYQGIIVGSPTYYGTMAYQLKELFDASVSFHGKLDGRVGAAFSSSANIAGGNETTILDILNAMLIHGMIIQGDPDSRSKNNCMRMGARIAKLVKKLFP
jgi:NAD(P)H dehydrogenase (quinone)